MACNELRRRQSTERITIAIRRLDRQLDRFPHHAKYDRVLTRIVASAQSMVADFGARPFAGATVAAVDVVLLTHLLGDQLAEAECRAAGSILLVLLPIVGQPPRASARRNLCQLRCGGERRMCKLDCRDKGDAARECKRICNLVRDVCFERCRIWRREVVARPVARLTAGRGT